MRNTWQSISRTKRKTQTRDASEEEGNTRAGFRTAMEIKNDKPIKALVEKINVVAKLSDYTIKQTKKGSV